jgi:ATP-binding cassette subfamily B protein
MPDQGISFAGYRRAVRFIAPYWPRLVFVLLAGVAATAFGLLQPYISKLLIDDALLKRNLRMLLIVSALMFGVTVLGFVLNIFSSYQYVRVSAGVLFDMRVALYQHLQKLSPRFWARRKLGDVVSRINNDIAEVQRVTADSLLSVLSNVVFLIGSAAIMIGLNPRLFLVSVAAVPASIWALQHYQHRLAARVRTVRERSADIGSFLLETLLGIRLVISVFPAILFVVVIVCLITYPISKKLNLQIQDELAERRKTFAPA